MSAYKARAKGERLAQQGWAADPVLFMEASVRRVDARAELLFDGPMETE
ncbi:MAG: hypothetical protein GDA41_07910 [Rhodospirillales bacterium]|nr:hypothetical protein [Rhodospirillales bacterium]